MLLSPALRFASQNARLCRRISTACAQQLSLPSQAVKLNCPRNNNLPKIGSFPHTLCRSYATHIERRPHSENFFLRQVFKVRPVSNSFLFSVAQFFDRESCTYSYLLADAHSKEAVIIDPVIDLIERDFETVHELGLVMKYACNFLHLSVNFN